MADCVIRGQVTAVTIIGRITSQSISGIIKESNTRPAKLLMRLAASDRGIGEQIFNVTGNGIVIVTLPLLNAISAGRVQTFILTATKKSHTTAPSYLDVELFDVDTPSVGPPDEIFQAFPGGDRTILQFVGDPTTGGQGIPFPTTDEFLALAQIEPIINFSNVSERVFHTKGVVGSIGLAIRINGGSVIDYDFAIQVLGEALA